MSHTKGPWSITAHTAASPDEITAACDWTVFGLNGEQICYEGSPTECAAANARLIAAAPDLLHALSLALPYVEDALEDPCYKEGTVAKAIRIIKDALAKAEA